MIRTIIHWFSCNVRRFIIKTGVDLLHGVRTKLNHDANYRVTWSIDRSWRSNASSRNITHRSNLHAASKLAPTQAPCDGRQFSYQLERLEENVDKIRGHHKRKQAGTTGKSLNIVVSYWRGCHKSLRCLRMGRNWGRLKNRRRPRKVRWILWATNTGHLWTLSI